MTMLRQTICGLRKMHELKCSHGDLKPENICARIDSKGNLKFTLIDLGLVSKIPNYGQKLGKRLFKGNIMFASFY